MVHKIIVLALTSLTISNFSSQRTSPTPEGSAHWFTNIRTYERNGKFIIKCCRKEQISKLENNINFEQDCTAALFAVYIKQRQYFGRFPKLATNTTGWFTDVWYDDENNTVCFIFPYKKILQPIP